MTGVELASAADAAAGILHADEAIRAAELARAVAVLEYCDRHRVDETILVEGAERIITGGADGTPGIGEFVVGEIAAILGMSLGWTFGHIASLLNLRHRHPGLWEHTRAGDVRVWEATRVADAAAAADLGLEACLAFDRMCVPRRCACSRGPGCVVRWRSGSSPPTRCWLPNGNRRRPHPGGWNSPRSRTATPTCGVA